MNHEALLGLLASLFAQLQQSVNRVAELEAELASRNGEVVDKPAVAVGDG